MLSLNDYCKKTVTVHSLINNKIIPKRLYQWLIPIAHFSSFVFLFCIFIQIFVILPKFFFLTNKIWEKYNFKVKPETKHGYKIHLMRQVKTELDVFLRNLKCKTVTYLTFYKLIYWLNNYLTKVPDCLND